MVILGAMVRTFLLLGFLALRLAVGQLAYGRPPDAVVNSPIPPLTEPVQRKAPRPVAKEPVEQGILFPIPPAQPTAVRPREVPAANSQPRGPEDYLTEQTELWNSSAMREARQHVVEFSRRSAHTSPQEGQQFLQQLSKLPPNKMQSWLKRYQERRLRIALEREVEQLARQLMVERALNRQEAMRQAFAHVSQLRAEAAEAMQMQRQLGPTRLMPRGDILAEHAWPAYDPLEAVVDPASPRGYRRRVAGAMSLPGDLPPDDPRNFIEGDEGVDFGEWATSRDAEPPVR